MWKFNLDLKTVKPGSQIEEFIEFVYINASIGLVLEINARLVVIGLNIDLQFKKTQAALIFSCAVYWKIV